MIAYEDIAVACSKEQRRYMFCSCRGLNDHESHAQAYNAVTQVSIEAAILIHVREGDDTGLTEGSPVSKCKSRQPGPNGTWTGARGSIEIT